MVVAGDGPAGESLRMRVRRAGLDSVFALLGHVDDMPKVLAEADVVVVPSRAEGIPLIVLEAMATAKPVVCSAVGAVSEALDPSAGILIESGPGVARRFAFALQGLLENPGLRDAMGQAGRRKVEAEYDQRRSRRAYAIYSSLRHYPRRRRSRAGAAIGLRSALRRIVWSLTPRYDSRKPNAGGVADSAAQVGGTP